MPYIDGYQFMKGLSKKQKEVLVFIQEFIKFNGYSPSYREIQAHFGYSSLGTVYSIIKVLKQKNALEALEGSSRSLTVPVTVPEVRVTGEVTIPFIGYIAAGFPIETFPQMQSVSLPGTLVPTPEHTYVLRAIGDTLNEELIADGDLLIIEARQDAHSGEVVIGLIKRHDTFIKRYFPEGDYIRLEGRNTHSQSLLLEKEEVSIQGVLIGVLRQYESV